MKPILKKTGKIFLWAFATVIFLLLTIVVTLQIPAVQNFAAQKATAFLQKKTHARISVERVGISFPKSVFISKLLVMDLDQDTLLYAGELKVNIRMLALLKGNINIPSVRLENANARLARKENDSLYNFNFLIEAFAGEKKASTEKKTTEGPELNFGSLELENVRFAMDDKYAGLNLNTHIKSLEGKIDKTNIDDLNFSVDELNISGFTGMMVQSKKSETSSESESATMPHLQAKKIKIESSRFSMIDKIAHEAITVQVGNFKLTDSDVNLTKQTVQLESINLKDSYAHLTFNNLKDTLSEKAIITDSNTVKNNWKITVNDIQLKNNSFQYKDISATSAPPNSFDPSNINISNLTFDARKFFYSDSLMKITIKDLKLNSEDKMKIETFQTEFRMTNHSFEANKLILKTEKSEFIFNAKMEFGNPESLKNNPGKIYVESDIKKIKLFHPELAYFVPSLKSEPAFMSDVTTKVKGKIQGAVEDLTVSALQLSTGASTKLYGDMHLRGLPEVKLIDLNIPSLTLKSTAEDVKLFAGNRVPSTIRIPDDFELKVGYDGTFRDFESKILLTSSMGGASINAEMNSENAYDISAGINNFNIGELLRNTKTLGIIDGTLKVKGSGLDTNTVNALVKADINRLTLNKYNYNNLIADVKINRKNFEGKVSLKDENAEFDLNGKADFNRGNKKIDISLDLKGIDLRKTNLSDQDLRLAFKAVADLEGSDINSVNGTAGITGIVLAKAGKKYILDSLLFAAINKDNNSRMNIKSAVIGIDYQGTFAPGKLADELKHTFSNYFPIDTAVAAKRTKPQKFKLDVELNNHPVISEVFLPELKAFEPGKISVAYNSEDKKLETDLEIHRLHYGNLEVEEFKADIDANENDFVYTIKAAKIISSDMRLDKFLIDGKIKDKIASTLVSAEDQKGNEKILLRSLAEMNDRIFKISLREFALMGKNWELSKDNYILFGKEGIQFNNFLLSKSESTISVNSERASLNSDISANFKNVKLEEFAGIIQKDTLLLSGSLNGDLQLKRVNKAWGIISDFEIKNLHFRSIPIGELSLKARNEAGNQFDINVHLSGNGNALAAKGYFKPAENGSTLDFEIDIQPLAMKTVEAFSMGQLSQTEGTISGKLMVKGEVNSPVINGSLTFREVKLNPSLLNSLLYLKNESITFDNNVLNLKSFTLLDKNEQPAEISGSVNLKKFDDVKFDLNVNTKNFLLLNTTKNKNSDYYGTLFVDSKIKVKGSPDHPVITSTIKLKDKSRFTFALPESKLSTDKGEGVVLFVDSTKFNPILTRDQKEEKQKSSVRNLDISSTIEIDKKASLKLLLDPASEDSLVVRGSGALSFAIDPSGKITLTGLYNIVDGTYMVSLEKIMRRKFKIEPGSSITWNGDPLDATINLNAFYLIRTSPIDLVADQLPPSERNLYRQRFPFLVYLNLKGPILTPEINFDIRLPAADRGIMNGMINARLEQLKENPSALNKQVFALLVLGRFIQENPLETEGGGGTATAARRTVGNFLSAQLNKFTSKLAPGVDVNFDVQSYEDYSTGTAQGRTELGLGLSKSLFDDRVSVQVGGSVDVEGNRAGQNNASDIAGDVTVEYKLTKDGRYRLKGFRLNQYEGALEGQIIQTGIGLLYTRDFETWLQLISSEKKEKENSKLNNEKPDLKSGAVEK